jgi:hypothetical protein
VLWYLVLHLSTVPEADCPLLDATGQGLVMQPSELLLDGDLPEFCRQPLPLRAHAPLDHRPRRRFGSASAFWPSTPSYSLRRRFHPTSPLSASDTHPQVPLPTMMWS